MEVCTWNFLLLILKTQISWAGKGDTSWSPVPEPGLAWELGSPPVPGISCPTTLTTQQLPFIFRKGRKGGKNPWILEHLTSKMSDFPHQSQKKILCKYKSFWHFSFVLSQHCQSNPWANSLVPELSQCKAWANFTRNSIKPKNKARVWFPCYNPEIQ